MFTNTRSVFLLISIALFTAVGGSVRFLLALCQGESEGLEAMVPGQCSETLPRLTNNLPRSTLAPAMSSELRLGQER